MELILQPPSLEKRMGLFDNDMHEGEVPLSWPREGDLGGEFDSARSTRNCLHSPPLSVQNSSIVDKVADSLVYAPR